MLILRNILYREHFESGEESKCEEEIDLTPQDRIVIIDWCKCRCECKSMATFTESFCLFPCLKSPGARGEHLAIQLLLATAQLLVTRVSLIYLVDKFLFLFLL